MAKRRGQSVWALLTGGHGYGPQKIFVGGKAVIRFASTDKPATDTTMLLAAALLSGSVEPPRSFQKAAPTSFVERSKASRRVGADGRPLQPETTLTRGSSICNPTSADSSDGSVAGTSIATARRPFSHGGVRSKSGRPLGKQRKPRSSLSKRRSGSAELQHRLNNVCDHLVASLAALRERDAAAAAHLAEERLRVDKESRETLSRMLDAGLNLAQQAVAANTSRKRPASKSHGRSDERLDQGVDKPVNP